MKKRNATLKAILNYALPILFFLLCANNANAQQGAACKAKLDSDNNLSPFPEARIADYKNCLDIIEKYFYSIDPGMQKNNENIDKLKTNLLKSKNNLSSGRATKTDSVNYKILEETTNADIKNLTESNNTLMDQKSKYRASLEKSFKTIFDYFTSIESSEKAIYKAKSDKLNAYR